MSVQIRIPQEIANIKKTIRTCISGFDRIHFWIDHPAPLLPLKSLRQHCRNIVIKKNQGYSYHAIWQCKVIVYQPDQEGLRLLADAIREEGYRVRPAYAEIALDHITKDCLGARRVRNFILKHMLVPHCRDEVVCEKKQTFYFHRRTDGNGKQTAHVVTVYCDRPSKLRGEHKGKPCSHLEHRFSGANALRGIGIYCMEDFASFRHDAFWNSQLRLADLPRKTKLARFLAPKKAKCSGTALRKRADKFLRELRLEGVRVLQNIRLAERQIEQVLRPLPNSLLLSRLV
jgi:hypothetical protein